MNKDRHPYSIGNVLAPASAPVRVKQDCSKTDGNWDVGSVTCSIDNHRRMEDQKTSNGGIVEYDM